MSAADYGRTLSGLSVNLIVRDLGRSIPFYSSVLELRLLYEPYVVALSELLLMPLPPWILPANAIDNWKTSAWGRIQ